jgi:NAD(P)-dependent dehydrogenase (short-subunit alcohol dehydrogenase family)
MTMLQSERTRPQSLSYDLTGQRVVVVGGKSGIGLGIAQAAHAAGASVTVASRRSAAVADHPELAPFEQIRLDVSDGEAVRAAFDAIGGLDHLVVAAGPTDGTWGAFMDDDMRGVRRYTTSKYLGSWACAMPARDFPRTGPSPS